MKWQYLCVADLKDSTPHFRPPTLNPPLIAETDVKKVRHLYLFHVVFKCIAKKRDHL